MVASDTINHRYHFAICEEPYTADADVELPLPSDTARLRLSVAMDPLASLAKTVRTSQVLEPVAMAMERIKMDHDGWMAPRRTALQLSELHKRPIWHPP